MTGMLSIIGYKPGQLDLMAAHVWKPASFQTSLAGFRGIRDNCILQTFPENPSAPYA